MLSTLKKRASEGDLTAAAQLVEKKLDLGHWTAAEARLKLKAMSDLTSTRRAALSALIDKIAYSEIFAAYVGMTIDAKDAVTSYRKLSSTGARPPEKEAATFWYLMAVNSLDSTDQATFEIALHGLESLEIQDRDVRENMKMANKSLRARSKEIFENP